jgi:hypothetical protein
MRQAPSEMAGGYDLRGSYRLAVSTGAVTLVAARTASAGQLFVFRWAPDSLTSHKAYVRYIGARFYCSTPYTTDQETGVDLIVARSFTVSATGATAVDLGSTVTNTGKYRTAQATSLVVANACRVADTGAITAGTHTLDANPIGLCSEYIAETGDMVPKATRMLPDGFYPLWDARNSNYPLVLADDEGFVIRNLVLMGAAGVGRWDFLVEWDEGLPNGGQS